MSDNVIEPDEDTDEPVTAVDSSAPDPADDTDTEDHPDAENPNKREARYRLQLRETEAERDQLRETVAALQRAEVERLAGQRIQKPQAIWASDIELGQLLDDAGRVDEAKVAAAVKTAADTLGLALTRPRSYVPHEGKTVEQPRHNDSWSDAFKAG